MKHTSFLIILIVPLINGVKLRSPRDVSELSGHDNLPRRPYDAAGIQAPYNYPNPTPGLIKSPSVDGYHYPKPIVPFPTHTTILSPYRTTTRRPTTQYQTYPPPVTGYSYPRPARPFQY